MQLEKGVLFMALEIGVDLADVGDVPEIARIMDEAYRQMECKDWFCTDDAPFLERHVRDEGFILKAAAEDVIAGFLVVRYPGSAPDNLGIYLGLSDDDLGLTAHMESAAVQSSYRGHGIQKRLMEEAESLLRRQGYRYLMGTAHPDNIYSVNNFLRLGYEVAGEDMKYGGLPRYIFCRRISFVTIHGSGGRS